jgi:hypothetical protein
VVDNTQLFLSQFHWHGGIDKEVSFDKLAERLSIK